MESLAFSGDLGEERRGGAAADAVVGAGEPIGRQNQPGFGGSPRQVPPVPCPPGAAQAEKRGRCGYETEEGKTRRG